MSFEVLSDVLGHAYFFRLNANKESLAADIEAHWPVIVAAIEAGGGRFLDTETP